MYGAELPIDELRLVSDPFHDIPRAYTRQHRVSNLLQMQSGSNSIFQRNKSTCTVFRREGSNTVNEILISIRWTTRKSEKRYARSSWIEIKLIVHDCPHDDSHADVSLSLVGYSKTFDSRMFTPLWPSQRGWKLWSLRVTGGDFPSGACVESSMTTRRGRCSTRTQYGRNVEHAECRPRDTSYSFFFPRFDPWQQENVGKLAR